MTSKEIAREIVTVWDGQNRDELRSIIKSAIDYEREAKQELLKACKTMLGHIEKYDWQSPTYGEVVSLAQSAIQKAGAK